jgi:hypothetical protein
MTRARNRTDGLDNPQLIRILLDALGYARVSLAQGAGSALGMIFNRSYRTSHTQTAREDLRQVSASCA